MMKNSVQCGITDATLTWKLPKGCSVINAPEKVPPVFQGEALILYGIISGDVSKVFKPYKIKGNFAFIK